MQLETANCQIERNGKPWTVEPSARTWRGRLRAAFCLCLLLPLIVVHRCAFWIDGWIFPWLHKVKINKPLFIVGLPRSGTTLFHRLVACGRDSFTTIPLWELVFAPALCEKYFVFALYRVDCWLGGGRTYGPGARLLRWIVTRLSKSIEDVHPTDLCEPEEDYLGLIPFDGCFLRVLLWPHADSTWSLGHFSWPSNESNRRLRLMKIYRGLVQRHLAFRGDGVHLVSKNPGFAAWLPALAAEFKDACFVGLRRDPKEAVPSQLSSIRGGLVAFGYTSEDHRIVQNFVTLLAHYWYNLEVAKSTYAPSRFQLIEYADLVQRPTKVTGECLGSLAYRRSAGDESRLNELAQSMQGFRSRHRYSLVEFGLTEPGIERAFCCSNELFSNEQAQEQSLCTHRFEG